MISSIYNSGKYITEIGRKQGVSKKQLELEETQFLLYGKRKLQIYKDLYELATVAKYQLNNWEIDFVNSVSRQKTWSWKQTDIINKLIEKYLGKSAKVKRKKKSKKTNTSVGIVKKK
jgi:hypothetical protein